MKKFLLFLFVFGISFTLYNTKAFAYTLNELKSMYSNVAYFPNPDYRPEFYWEPYVVIVSNGLITFEPDGKLHGRVGDQDVFINWYTFSNLDNNSNGTGSGQPFKPLYPIILLQGNFMNRELAEGDIYLSEEDYENEEPWNPEISWWDSLGLWVEDFFGDILGVASLPVQFWEWIWGSSDDPEDQPDLDIYQEPSPTPLPTMIPYSTTINPSTGDIEYHYEISGIPITATAPPPVPTYIITLPPDQGIAMPSGIYYSDDGLQDVIDAIDDNVTDYTPGINTIKDSFSSLPVKWFAFFGIPAAILIIAGVIKSLLG